jgi:hypothetical protein
MLGEHRRNILGGDRGIWMQYLCCVYLFCIVDQRKNGLLDLRDGATMIFCIACKKFFHLLVLLSLLAFLERLVDFVWHIIE